MADVVRGFHRRGFYKLGLGVSLSVIAMCGASPAFAQSEEQSAAPAEDYTVIVTGTRIEGVAPVGSSVIPVLAKDLQKIGASTTNDALRKIPQIVNFGGSNDQTGGSTIQNSSLNTFYAKSINLRGLGTASTLSLVNGHRVAPQGPSGQLFDADNIPAMALERIEIVADGGSAIYGSDAIGGVANFIMRRPEDTLEVQARVGFADAVEEYIGTVVAGKKWSSGGILVAYEYQKRTALEAAARPNLYNSDLSPYGGGAASTNSNPANVIINNVTYGIPAGQNGTAVSLGSLTATPNRMNQWEGAYGVPSGERHSAIMTFEQDLTPGITFKADGLYSRHEFEMHLPAAFASINVANTNPYSPCYTGRADNSPTLDCPANGTVAVPYNFLYDLGPTVDTGHEEIWSISAGFDVALTSSWKLNLLGYWSENRGWRLTSNQVNGGSLATAVNTGVGGTFFNPFCDGRSFDCNSDAVSDSFRAWTGVGSLFRTKGVSGSVSGDLFELPGGPSKLAVGGEYHHDYLFGTGQSGNSRTPNATIIDPGLPTDKSREVSSAYAEIFAPVVPGLELNAAVRYDHYSDVGSTTNPKFGVNYSPVPGLTFRGSYGTSFRAPTLVDVNMYATAGFLARTGSGAAVGLSPANNTFNYIYQVGGNEDLKPEKAETWSLGFDVGRGLLPGFNMSLTYYNIVYTDRVDTPAYNVPPNAALNSGAFDSLVVLNPQFFPGKATMTQAEYNAFVTSHVLNNPDGLQLFGPPLANVQDYIAIIDGRRQNGGVVKTDGLDFLANYTFDAGGFDIRLGGVANYIFNYKNAPLPTVALDNEVNHFGYPARFTARAEAGIDVGGFSGTLFLNHVGARTITRAYLPATSPDQYMNIDSLTTFDLTLRYGFEDTGSGLLDGLAFSVSVQNLFDADPPLVVNTGGTPVRFDPSYSSSLGRFISFTLTKKLF